jgi:hypothetical protein
MSDLLSPSGARPLQSTKTCLIENSVKRIRRKAALAVAVSAFTPFKLRVIIRGWTILQAYAQRFAQEPP